MPARQGLLGAMRHGGDGLMRALRCPGCVGVGTRVGASNVAKEGTPVNKEHLRIDLGIL